MMQNQASEAVKITDWLTAICAVLAFLVSIVALVIANRTQKDSKISAEASQRSASAGEEAAGEAKRAADIAQKALSATERSAIAAEKSVTTSVDMFKRQGVIDLFEAWEDVRDIDTSTPITPDVVRAVRALELTASLWNHSIVEKSILHQSFWDDYKDLYNKLFSMKTLLPGLTKSGSELLTRRVSKAYTEMDNYDIGQEPSSEIKI
jgi:hypothetical protein